MAPSFRQAALEPIDIARVDRSSRLEGPSRPRTETASCMRSELTERAWNPTRGAFTAGFGLDDLDASVLLLPELLFGNPRSGVRRRRSSANFCATTALCEDDFGLPEPPDAVFVCRFWLIDVSWDLGRHEQVREMFDDALRYRNRYGLLAEDIDPITGELLGNFQQTYSVVGLILTSTRLSRSWEDRFWRG
jgi:GH15 family glucan-1,4-alpha-glucosidase